MSFREDMVDSIQNIGPIEQRFEQIDLLRLSMASIFTEIAVAGDDRTRLGIQGGVPIEPSVPC